MRIYFLLFLLAFYVSPTFAQQSDSDDGGTKVEQSQFVLGGLHIPFVSEISGAGAHFELGNRYLIPSTGTTQLLINAAWMGLNLNFSFDPEIKLSVIEIQPLKIGPGFQAEISENAHWVMAYQVMPTFGLNPGGVLTNSNYWAIFHGPWVGVKINKLSVGAEVQLGQMNFIDDNNLSKNDKFIAYARLVIGSFF